MDQTALLVPVPRVGPLIDPWRSRHDPSASQGIPPHVTILFPFLPPGELTTADVEDVQSLVAARPAFDVKLATIDLFDTDVLHIRPEPDTPFRELTTAIHDRFPQAPPYGGRHPDVIPHLTVGHRIPRPSAKHAARALMLALPIRIHVDVVQLWVHGPAGWTVGASFPLGIDLPRVA